MPSLTRSTIVTRIGQLIGDPNNTRFSSSQKQDRIQEAQEQFVLETRVLTDVTTASLTAGTQEYDLPSDVMDIKRMSHDGLLLKRISKFDLDINTGVDWTDTTKRGVPRLYYVDLDPNNKKFGIYPIASADAVAEDSTVDIEYIKIPPALSSDSSVPFDGHTLLTPYHEALAYHAAANLLMIEPDERAVKMANDYRKEYDRLVSHCIETFKDLSVTTPKRMRSGRNLGGI